MLFLCPAVCPISPAHGLCMGLISKQGPPCSLQSRLLAVWCQDEGVSKSGCLQGGIFSGRE